MDGTRVIHSPIGPLHKSGDTMAGTNTGSWYPGVSMFQYGTIVVNTLRYITYIILPNLPCSAKI